MTPEQFTAVEKFAKGLKEVLESRMKTAQGMNHMYACAVDVIEMHLSLAAVEMDKALDAMADEHYKHREKKEPHEPEEDYPR